MQEGFFEGYAAFVDFERDLSVHFWKKRKYSQFVNSFVNSLLATACWCRQKSSTILSELKQPRLRNTTMASYNLEFTTRSVSLPISSTAL